jgi:hypothetical protein
MIAAAGQIECLLNSLLSMIFMMLFLFLVRVCLIATKLEITGRLS